MVFYRERQEALAVQGLKEAVQDSLAKYLYSNAIFCAERLYALAPTHESLHTLAHCYVTSGDAGTAYRLLRMHYPFLMSTTAASNTTNSNNSGHSTGGGSGTTADAAARWDCQYLLGVTCGMTQRYMEGEGFLEELERHRSSSEVLYWLGVCRQHLRRSYAEETFAKSALLDPLNFMAFENHIKMTLTPRKEVCSIYADATMPVALTEDVMRRSSMSEGGGTQRHRKREAVRLHLSRFASVTFMQWTYRCKEAQELLKHETFPERDSGWALGALAMAYFHDGDVENATKVFAHMRRVEPWRLADPALVYYSTALWQRKEMGTLGSLSQTLINEMPTSPITLCVVANAHSLVKESKEALCMLNRAIQVDHDFASAHALRGYELLYLDLKSEAADAFHEAILIDVGHYNAYAGLGELYFRNEDLQKARHYFRQAFSINPLPAIVNRYAATYHRRGASRESLNEALRIYENAIRRHPSNLGARHQRAEVLIHLGRLDEARRELLGMTKECPDEAMLYVTLAKCVHLMGLPDQALQYYYTAMDLDPRRAGYIKSCLEKLGMGDSEVVEPNV
ncbi:anaphase-promoting complex subunit 3 [Trypanosoma rangeli]|uniref:Anaphase-promoting complex subunit 3 n=1 Tax=Trypanosoma rangeli TaxID=5698 RepID=A0A3R7JYU4_TRYRA|nr:anaphase-promoting complex subunit 3 [Trypanosoma rangeli]RNE99048.1 anaphase-promoting complex subunit 3 [Trypanosoma rangeli]|eukprot:RNE99048.1 anaphase-promoting complex subunit 3 [Trypanosoma rangeli]